ARVYIGIEQGDDPVAVLQQHRPSPYRDDCVGARVDAAYELANVARREDPCDVPRTVVGLLPRPGEGLVDRRVGLDRKAVEGVDVLALQRSEREAAGALRLRRSRDPEPGDPDARRETETKEEARFHGNHLRLGPFSISIDAPQSATGCGEGERSASL